MKSNNPFLAAAVLLLLRRLRVYMNPAGMDFFQIGQLCHYLRRHLNGMLPVYGAAVGTGILMGVLTACASSFLVSSVDSNIKIRGNIGLVGTTRDDVIQSAGEFDTGWAYHVASLVCYSVRLNI